MSDLYDEQMKLTYRLQGLVNQFGDDLSTTLESALKEVEGKLILLASKAEQTPSLVKKKQYLQKQREEIQKVLNDVYKGIGQEIKTTAIETARATPGLIHKIIIDALPAAFEVSFSVPKLSTKQTLLWWESSQIEGSFFNDWLKKLEANTVDRVVSESRRSLVLHEDPLKTSARIEKALGIGRNSASTLLNTALQEAVNYAELEYYKENSARITGVLFVAELDRRTCPTCKNLDQTVYPTKEAQQFRPPIHASCRCRLFPIFSFGDIYEGAKRISRKDTKPRLVNHRDGTTETVYEGFETELVPFHQTYNQWMDSMVNSSDPKDVAFAKEALGPTRFDLVKSGKLQMDSLYYQGRLRNIQNLRS
jgi:SPP1 gp7 family putative phage head morphogenesis protein